MTRHLSADEFAEAAEGTLDAARAAHVETCASCAAEVSSLRSLLREIEPAGDIPEPSPLFWDHMSARVRLAALASAPTPWWSQIGWRPLAAVSAAVAVVLVFLMARPSGPAPAPDTTIADVAPADEWLPALEDGSFDVVLEMASELEWDEVRQVAAPRAGTADALIQELSPAEREQLVKLLRSEIGELE